MQPGLQSYVCVCGCVWVSVSFLPSSSLYYAQRKLRIGKPAKCLNEVLDSKLLVMDQPQGF